MRILPVLLLSTAVGVCGLAYFAIRKRKNTKNNQQTHKRISVHSERRAPIKEQKQRFSVCVCLELLL